MEWRDGHQPGDKLGGAMRRSSFVGREREIKYEEAYNKHHVCG